MKPTSGSIDRDTKNAITALNAYLLLMAGGMVLWIVMAVWLLAPFNTNKEIYENFTSTLHRSAINYQRNSGHTLAVRNTHGKLDQFTQLQPAGNSAHERTTPLHTEKPALHPKAQTSHLVRNASLAGALTRRC